MKNLDVDLDSYGARNGNADSTSTVCTSDEIERRRLKEMRSSSSSRIRNCSTCELRVYDKPSYFITAKVTWCFVRNCTCVTTYTYRGEKPQVHVEVYNISMISQVVRAAVGRQIKVLLMMVVASVMAIVQLLLLMSGDVEENPGPPGEAKMSLTKLYIANVLSIRPSGFAVRRRTHFKNIKILL